MDSIKTTEGWAYLTHVKGDVWELSDIYTHISCRRLGVGERMLKAICAQADEQKVTLELVVCAGTGVTDDVLHRWYARHGFVPDTTYQGAVLFRVPR